MHMHKRLFFWILLFEMQSILEKHGSYHMAMHSFQGFLVSYLDSNDQLKPMELKKFHGLRSTKFRKTWIALW